MPLVCDRLTRLSKLNLKVNFMVYEKERQERNLLVGWLFVFSPVGVPGSVVLLERV